MVTGGRPISRLLLLLFPLLLGCTGMQVRGPCDCAAVRARMPGPQVETGWPVPILDLPASWVFGLPGKLILWNRRVDDHKVDPATVAEVQAFLDAKHLHAVKVRVNQYAPVGEFRRLWWNKRMNLVFRGTLGLLAWAEYTVLPQRLLGGDNYNPFSDTMNLYSSDRVIALHEAGHAKDDADQMNPGLYALARLIPGVDLYQEYRASREAIAWFRAREGPHGVRRSCRRLYPAFGTYVGGTFDDYLPPFTSLPLSVAGAVVGHAVAKVATARHRAAERRGRR